MSQHAGRPVLRLGTRGSLLARTQARQVADAVEAANPGVAVELVLVKTTGDRVQDRPLADLGGKGLFTKEVEQALLAGSVDFAVHSYKDVPVTMPLVDTHDLVIAAVPPREDVRDVLIAPEATDIRCLPLSAKVGTGSLRRRCQLLALRPDLRVEMVRGNVDTRLGKLAAGEFDAIILAAAGIRRLGLFDPGRMALLGIDDVLPAPGQGALAIQCRRADVHTLGFLRPLHDPATAACVALERDVVQQLNGDCHSPIGAYATLDNGRVTLRAALGGPDGVAPVRRAEQSARLAESGHLANAVATAVSERSGGALE